MNKKRYKIVPKKFGDSVHYYIERQFLNNVGVVMVDWAFFSGQYDSVESAKKYIDGLVKHEEDIESFERLNPPFIYPEERK